MITLKDIAKEAGISITQTSRALNDYSDVNEKTKENVRAIAKKLGYIKNITAQNLATSTSNQIGYIVVGLEEDHNGSEYSNIYPIICGINDYIINTGYGLAVYFLKKSSVSYLNFARSKHLAGAIISGINYDDECLPELLQSNLPCVLIDVPVTNCQKKGCIVIDNSMQAAICIRKFIEIGRKNIIMISGHPHAYVSLERELGFKSTLIMNHMSYDDSMIYRADFDEKTSYEITFEIIRKHPNVDAIFCASDFMAIGCLRSLIEQGLNVPRDVAIIGFDGIPQTKYVSPTITTIVQDNYQNGFCSARLLHEYITDVPVVTNTITLECTLIERESTQL